MKNRDKWITIAFMIFILVIPFVTVIRNCLPQEEAGLSQEEIAILENNGTIQSGSDGEVQEKDEENSSSEQVGEKVKEPLFTRVQNSLNNFTNGLFGRTKLIALNTELTSIITGGTYIESTQVLMGKNNMFFYKTELDGHPIWDYMGINHFSDEELSAIAQNLTAARDHLNEKGIEFYVMCVPNKEIIYEENMPDTIARVNEISRGEQLDNYLEENTDLVYVYPKEALLAEKENTQLYYSTDSHCNQKGAFVNMQELFSEVYGTKATLDSVEFEVHDTEYTGDLAAMAGLSDKYKIDTVYVFDTESADKAQYNDQVLLFIGDSFGGFLSAVSEGYYKEVIWKHPDSFEYSMYEEYDPDVVIWERAERYCEKFMATNIYTP